MRWGWNQEGTGRRVIVAAALVISGCAVKFSQRSPWDVQQLQTLSDQLEQFRTLAQLKAEEADQLRQAKDLLEQRLSSEIASSDVTVGFDERGLVVRVLDRVLFDSGKAELRHDAHPVLEKVARILQQQLKEQPISIEGHTDNQPIKRSHWKDNWELSLARSRAVLKYLVDEQKFEPSRVSAAGFGEYRPIASNDTAKGRRLNRRVEIVAMPQRTTASAPASAAEAAASSRTVSTK